jgi:hypothetical protein
MSANRKDIPWINSNSFNENTSKLPAEERAKYYGKHVAWSLDGCRILASGDDNYELMENVYAAGLDVSQVVLGYVPLPDETLL